MDPGLAAREAPASRIADTRVEIRDHFPDDVSG